MKHLFLLIAFCFLLSACRDGGSISEPPEPQYTLVGEWRSLTPAHPNWHYRFDDVFLYQTLYDFGQPIVEHKFLWGQVGDTLHIAANATNPARRWLLQWHCDSVLEVTTANENQPLQSNFLLKRTR
jgi:hypothetical protein